MSAKVLVRDLRKSYGPVAAAAGVSFEIQDGEIFGLIGPNGAGKTTTIECVIGLRAPDAGDISVCGIDARRHPRDVKEKIGAALQTVAIQDKLTPREALALFGGFYRQRATPESLLSRFRLEEKADAPFDTLSGGQRQRLALALAFVNNPELVFLDEPTAGLDAEVRRDLRAEIAAMKRDGHTVLLTTHDIDEAEELCDRIAIIHRGRIVATGTPRELIAASTATTSIVLVTTKPAPRAWLAGLPDVHDMVSDGTTARFRSTNVSRTLAALGTGLAEHGLDLTELRVEKASLEDVLIELTRQGAGDHA
jgi:ABC-2 type transport system ATP-binding protein